MWSSASALTSCLGWQRYEVQLLHTSSAVPGRLKVWSFASAITLCLYCQRSEVPLSVLPLGQDFERSLFSSALVLPGLPNIGMSTSALELCLDCQRSEVPIRTSARSWLRKISFVFHTCSHGLPGLPNTDKSTSAFHLCQDFQRSEIPLPHFCFALTARDVKFFFLSSTVRSCYAFPHKCVRL